MRQTIFKYFVIPVATVVLFVGSSYVSTLFETIEKRRSYDELMVKQSLELARIAQSDKSITTRLKDLLVAIPGATMAGVTVIHNGTATTTRVPILYGDNLIIVGVSGFSAGDLQTNIPLARWADYLQDLQAGRCVYRKAGRITNTMELDRWRQMGIVSSVICPLANTSNQMMGVLSISWTEKAVPPTDGDIPRIIDTVQRVARDVAIDFETRLVP